MAFPPGAHVLHLSGIARSDDGAPTAIKYLLSNLATEAGGATGDEPDRGIIL
jgi:hypothetical protein